MKKGSSRTKGKRRVKASGSVRDSTGPTIASAAARMLRPLAVEAEELLAKVSSGRPGAKRVHKLRSALRRLEIMIGTLGCGFDGQRAEKVRKLVRRLRKSAGDVRDMDVAQRVVRDMCSTGDEGLERAGKEVEGLLGARRDKASKRLSALSKKEAGNLTDRLAEMLEATAGRRALLPARLAAVNVLARGAEAMREDVRAGLGTPELLHELRLNLKEARTVLELLADALGMETPALADRTRILSDVLGEINDCATLADLLGELEVKAGFKKKRASLHVVGALARGAQKSGHEAGVKRAAREVPSLVREIRAVAFGEMPARRG